MTKKKRPLTRKQLATLGGKASAASKTPRQRKILATKAANIRWGNR